MKNIILILGLVSFTLTSVAKEYSNDPAENINRGSERILIDDNTGAIKFIKLKDSQKISVEKNISWLSTILNVSSSEAFKLYKKESDKHGFTHYKYQQFMQGIPVEDGVFYIHTKNGFIISANGEYYPNIKIGSQSASISSSKAIEIAKNTIKNNKGKWNDKLVSFPVKVIVSEGNGIYSLAYKTDVYSQAPLARKFIYINATTGKVIKEKNRIHNADEVGSAATKYSGTQTITADSIGAGSYILKDNGRNVHTRDLDNAFFTGGAVDFTDTDNFWNNINAQQDEVATDAHWAAEMFYDYFLNTFGINSYDNAGAALNTYVHYGVNYDNAFWDGTSVSCGDGDGTNHSPHTAIDVIGHEFSHGIIENTANLVVSYESGSLAESYGDIFGTAIEFFAKPGSANYTFAENVSISSIPSRSLSNPNQYGHPDTYLGTNWATGPADNGGIHTNNGVQNYWFYLLTNGGSGVNDIGSSYTVTGIGILKAVSIAYRTLTVYLTTNSQYADARTFSIQAAVDLYGACSAEAVATQNAWYAVGIGAAASNSPVVASFSSDVQFSCSVPTTVNFTDLSQNATISHKWYFGDGDSSVVSSPSHIYTAAGVYTVTLIVEGIGSCGTQTDTLIQTNYITVTNGGGPIGISCSPITTSAGALGMGVFNFSLNTINNNTLGGTDSYQDYSCGQSTNLTEGNTYNVNIATGISFNENVNIWIDLDNNGVFAPVAEKVFESNNFLQNHSGTINIPGGAVLNTPLRLRVSSDYYLNGLDVCTNSQYGQHEDYTIVIQPNTSPPVVDFIADDVVVNISQAVNFTDLSQNVPTGWTWDFTGATPPNSSVQNPTVTYSSLGTYAVKLKATNAFGADSLTKTAYINVVNQFNMCGGAGSTNATSGIFFDSGGSAGNYSNNENCSFLINPGCAVDVTLSFTSFFSPTSSDFMLVYDGTDATGTLIGSYYNISTPPTSITATSGSMFITWFSNGSTNYSGWEASWNSTVPTSPPIANFSISNNNPPLNTIVSFTDLSTNFPGAWAWDFGDGNFASSQNPTHVYGVPGVYSVQLITDNCFALDTISYNLTVQDSAFITVQPDTLFATSLCGDSLSEQLTIFNSGNGDLVTSIVGASTNSISSAFYDGFESGNLSGWTMEAGIYTKQITSSNPGGGSYSLEFLNGTGAHLDGISNSFSNATPSEISFKLKNSSTSQYGSFVIIGDNPTSALDPMLYMFMNNNGTFYINGMNNVSSYTANQWVIIELKNVDWTAKTFDFYVDGSLVTSSMPFQNNSVTQLNKVHLYAWSSTSTCSFDDIQIGENIAPSWISMTTTDTLVPANDSVLVNVNFNAAGLLAGTYNDTLTIYSNDTTNSPLYVPVVFTVTGQPLISVSPSNFNFGSLQVGASTTDTLYIDNLGCDTLDISSFVPTNSSFTLNSGGFLIPPYSNDTVIITFSPDSIKTYADTIFINNNDTLAFVLVNGIGLGAPIISYNPTSIVDTVFGCNDSITIPLTIYNTGQGDLVYQIDGGIGLVGDTSILVIQDGAAWGGIWMNTFIQTNYGLSPTLINSSAIAATNFMLYDIVITVGNQSNSYYTNISANVAQFESFVNAGGIVQYQNASQGASGTNLVGGVQSNYGPQDNTNVNLLPTHPITLGLPVLLLGNSANHDVLSNIPAGAQIITETDATGLPTTIDYTFGAGRVVATGMTWTFLYNGGYNSGPMLTQSLDYIMSLIGSSSSWMSITPDTGTVAINDSTILNVTLYSAGLTGGTYTSQIVINSNDPVSPSDTIPVSFTVIGTPEIALSDTCLDFGSIMENSSSYDTLTIYNNGCDTLFVTNVTSGISEYTTTTTSLMILPGDSRMIDVTFSPVSVGAFNSTLTILNNDNDTTICLTGISTAAPIITVNPTSFNVNLAACADSITLPLTIGNIGGSNLEFEIVGAGGSGGTLEVLALTYGADMTTEYPNTISAINQYFTNYNLTAINTTNAATLQAALVGVDVFLVPEQESGSSAVFTGFATVLQNFVTNGGSVVFCGSAGTYSQAIFNTGLFSGSYVSNLTGSTLNLVNPTHPLANSIVTPVLASNATFYYNITNTDAYSIVEYTGSAVVTYREVGAGRVVLVGYDYYNTNNNSSRFIANAIEWAGTGSFANWMTLSQLTDTIVPADSTVINVTFYSAGLSGGSYYTDITINSNDPATPQVIVPCTLNIAFDPCADFTFNIPNNCSGQVDFTDETLNNPTTWQWTFDDGNFSTIQNPTHMYAGPGNYNVQLVACNATSCDTISYLVNITNTTGPIAAFCSPVTLNAGGFAMGIFNFTFNTINNSSTGGTDGYQDYTCTMSTVVTEGNTYAVNVTTGTGFNEDVRVWIDFDNDGQFNMTNELVFLSDNILQNHSGNILIPTGAILGTSLRMRVASDFEGLNITSSCMDVTYGQYEDYSILIQSNMSPPIANYSYIILDQCQGIVQFTDLSTNFPTSWVWDFDDVTTSTFQNPFHTFVTAGIYNVTLVATNAFGSSTVFSQSIVINSLNASIDVLSPTVINQPINFNANAPGAISWLWDFGDGFLSTLQSPSHTYTSTGIFIVTLTATNGFGCVSTVYDTINVTLVSIEEHDNYFMIYPNPNHGVLQIVNKSNENITAITIINALGEVVFRFKNETNHFSSQKIELNDVSTGVYFVKVLYEDNKFITRKFLIKK